MAEPPNEFSNLLIEKQYREFLDLAGSRGLLLHRPSGFEAQIAGIHSEISLQRHPPGPTVEWMVIEQLVAMNVLDRRIQEIL